VDGTVILGDARGWRGGGPAVAVGGPPAEGMPCVRADVRGGAAAAARHLVELGHAGLAVIGPPGTSERLEGAREGWGAAGPLVSYEAAGPTRADGEAAARVALGARPRPTALLALTDRLAWGTLDAAGRLGIAVPAELSVAGIDDLPGPDAPRLTSAFVPYLPIGELAGGLLGALIAGETPPAPPPLPTTLAIRATTAPPRRPRSG
jgi:DNA-binding LacI/PurR family transcriptional regulator